MKTPTRQTLTSKRVLLPAGALAGVLVLGGGAVAVGALGDSDELTGNDLDRASSAALKEVGSGKVVSAELSDDRGVAYDLEIRTSDGRDVDVELDDSFKVVRTESDRDDDRDDARDDRDGRDDRPDADDRRLDDGEWAQIEKAAIKEAGGGTMTDAEASDDRGVAYEAEVRLKDGTEVDVWLDETFAVVDSRVDRDDD